MSDLPESPQSFDLAGPRWLAPFILALHKRRRLFTVLGLLATADCLAQLADSPLSCTGVLAHVIYDNQFIVPSHKAMPLAILSYPLLGVFGLNVFGGMIIDDWTGSYSRMLASHYGITIVGVLGAFSGSLAGVWWEWSVQPRGRVMRVVLLVSYSLFSALLLSGILAGVAQLTGKWDRITFITPPALPQVEGSPHWAWFCDMRVWPWPVVIVVCWAMTFGIMWRVGWSKGQTDRTMVVYAWVLGLLGVSLAVMSAVILGHGVRIPERVSGYYTAMTVAWVVMLWAWGVLLILLPRAAEYGALVAKSPPRYKHKN
ncbi:MAG: hypothetical protein K8S99_17070 [Planctomycetes bacterium]|nr:hypothetical protein [Planctomycetota bacterium]